MAKEMEHRARQVFELEVRKNFEYSLIKVERAN